jgi:hypothetical protein
MSRATFGGDIPERAGGGPTPDGGKTGRDELPVGAVVLDREDDDPNRAVVVNRPPVRADEWTAYVDETGEEVTIADDNPSYDSTEEIVVVAFLDDLTPVRPEWAGESPLTLTDLHEDGASTYAFPPARLEPIGVIDPGARSVSDPDEAEDEGAEQSLTDDMEALAERLEEGATVESEFDGSTPTLRVEKLGSTYRITPDGVVEGDGPHADRLGEVATEYLEGNSR